MSDFQTKFYLNFIKDDRWKYITSGLGNTLKITVFALIFAVIIGVLVAIIRYSYDKNHTNKAGNFIQSLLQFLLAVANGICHVYLNWLLKLKGMSINLTFKLIDNLNIFLIE